MARTGKNHLRRWEYPAGSGIGIREDAIGAFSLLDGTGLTFGSYHYALHSDAAKTAAMLGHRANDQVLFDSYRSLARKKEAEAYFGIVP